MNTIRSLMVLAMAVGGLLASAAPSPAAKISGYLIVHNDTAVEITVYLDGKQKGTIAPSRRSSWLIGDKEERSSYTLSAEGSGVARQTIANGNYSDFEWRVKP